MNGTIFAVEEFSTYDGPGMRMTVFLKGCPLSCEWCHNPEGQSFDSAWVRSPNGCLSCGACLEAGRRERGTPCLTEASREVCPRRLVRLCGEEYTPEELLARLEKNLTVLNAVGGGVTFSGGEPLAQSEFLLACLRGLRGRTHRAVQTSGYASAEVLGDVLRETEFVLYDLKLMDDALHRRYTGVSNAAILDNYRLLAESDTEFITRVPLIPSVTDTQQNITAIAAFMDSLGVRRVELMPYNTMAGSKYALVDRKYCPSFDTSVTPTPHGDIWGQYGIEVTVL